VNSGENYHIPQRIIEGIEELRGLVGREAGSSDWIEVTKEAIDRPPGMEAAASERAQGRS